MKHKYRIIENPRGYFRAQYWEGWLYGWWDLTFIHSSFAGEFPLPNPLGSEEEAYRVVNTHKVRMKKEAEEKEAAFPSVEGPWKKIWES